ncbi:thiol:disulfide interchange protein DsbA/DsbL [Psychrobium sp. 1_MG-2023]|uniref:thiol:disulfide interchange protein DsbA/DsbL n=1 Tax=Psychrobium sp. 1_MG-2023 TaxID=3062624 RepID=UPI000C349850|nr:thiol:disulfide interchange protein DsbA/DsbL [Psychrobium sp. 1_MG-2023]MDP2562349.1 thiol:disulfide interchange protein DsbA/DsbL [Psychrobium sp. 1_MG-2023]PKF58043.1 hypothetical protein CW748_04375 [Alteromonadales bacterium alter-6D02]
MKVTLKRDVLKLPLFILAFVGLTACSPEPEVTQQSAANEFKVGVDYEVISEQASIKPKVVEHFSLYCGHCFRNEPLFASLKHQLGDSAPFERNHVIFLPQSRPEWGKNMTFAVAAARLLGVEDAVVEKVFSSHFVKNQFIGNIGELKQVFNEVGISEQQFIDTMNDEKALLLVKTMAEQAKQDGVRFTPDLIVNDKYRVILERLSGVENGDKQLANLVKYLLTNP